MTSSSIETIVAGLCLLFFGYVAWRGGAGNPVGTGQLQSQLNTVGSEIQQLKTQVQGCALTSEVSVLRGEIESMKAHVASSGEVVALEGQVMTLRVEIGAAVRAADRTEAGVNRIEGYFLERGINRQ